jgi:hypothetical protein
MKSKLGAAPSGEVYMRKLFPLLPSVSGIALLLGLVSPAHTETVATINGCYDCLAFDTPGLQFNNTSGGNLTNAQMVLQGYQGLNNGISATVNLGTIGAGLTNFIWGSLPGVSSALTPGNLTASDYDDEYIGTPSIINDPTCGGGGCVSGGGSQWYAQVGNFRVTFTATISGGTHDGQSVFSVFDPSNNATGGFLPWEGLDANGFSEQPCCDIHSGGITMTLLISTLESRPPRFPAPSQAPACPA